MNVYRLMRIDKPKNRLGIMGRLTSVLRAAEAAQMEIERQVVKHHLSEIQSAYADWTVEALIASDDDWDNLSQNSIDGRCNHYTSLSRQVWRELEIKEEILNDFLRTGEALDFCFCGRNATEIMFFF